MTRPPLAEDGSIALGEWWALHVPPKGERHLANILCESYDSLWWIAFGEGRVVLVRASSDDAALQTLRTEAHGVLLQTKGTLHVRRADLWSDELPRTEACEEASKRAKAKAAKRTATAVPSAVEPEQASPRRAEEQAESQAQAADEADVREPQEDSKTAQPEPNPFKPWTNEIAAETSASEDDGPQLWWEDPDQVEARRPRGRPRKNPLNRIDLGGSEPPRPLPVDPGGRAPDDLVIGHGVPLPKPGEWASIDAQPSAGAITTATSELIPTIVQIETATQLPAVVSETTAVEEEGLTQAAAVAEAPAQEEIADLSEYIDGVVEYDPPRAESEKPRGKQKKDKTKPKPKPQPVELDPYELEELVLNEREREDDEEDDLANQALIRIRTPDGAGPATRSYGAHTAIGRVIRSILASKPDHPLEVIDDVGMANATEAMLEQQFEDRKIAAVFTNGYFWRYDPETGVWIKLSIEDMRRIVIEAWWRHPHRKMTKKGPKDYPIQLSAAKIKSCVEVLELNLSSPWFFSDREKQTGGIAFRNGFATVVNGKVVLLSKDPDRRADMALPFDYDPSLRAPKWEKFLDEVMEPGDSVTDPEARRIEREKKKRLLGEYAGACLLGRATKYQKCLVMDGKGGNGKSVITKVMLGMFSSDAISSVAPQDWSHKFRLVMLVGKRLNVAAELPEKEILEGDVFKQVIAGDELSVEEKYGKPYNVRLHAGHLFSANELPHARDLSEGFWRRFMVLTLEQRFDNRKNVDIDLPERLLQEESGGIAAWCLEHAAMLEQSGGAFTMPSTSVTRKEEWRHASNPLDQCIAEIINKDPEAPQSSMPTTQLYEIYSAWCKRRGHSSLAVAKFSRRLKASLDNLGINAPAYNTKGVRGYRLALNPEWAYVLTDRGSSR